MLAQGYAGLTTNTFITENEQSLRKGSFIQYVRRIYQKTNISDPLIRTSEQIKTNKNYKGSLLFIN